MSTRAKPHLKPTTAQLATADSFQNFLTRTGIGAGSLMDGSSYGFNPITRNRQLLERIYRGSWIAGAVIDSVAEDMTREGVEINGEDDPKKLKELGEAASALQIWPKLSETIKWGRLYGGAIGVLMIDGQDSATQLRLDRVGKGQFRGILPLDRWMLQPTFSDLVTELGPDLGKPRSYDVIADSAGIKRMNVHYTRCVRMEGVALPWNQRITENLWGQSVIERLFDRLVAFDSTTNGAAQLVHKAHLRTYKVKDLRDIIAAGGPALDGLVKQINMIRAFQTNEGMTLMDLEDEFDAHQYTFSGLDNLLMQFGQQLSGATGIPLVRLFGQSPAGLNATGESDLRNYYDNIKQKQETDLRPDIKKIYEILYRSTFGSEPSKEFEVVFRSLWQMSDEQKADVTQKNTTAICTAYEKQLIDRATGLRELKQLADTTGAFSNITDEAITEAENDPAPTPEALGLKLPDPGPKPGTGEKGTGTGGQGGASVRNAA